jgi:cell division septation protein DedD/nucleoid DNA-binding protein
MVKHTIDHYISNLLYYNECVVVPGFGAFLTRYYSAEINAATHMFRPPSKRVAFNARIQENDGLLAQHIAKTEGVSFEKAMESIDISVRSWKKVLRSGKKVNLTGIGRLYMSDTGKLQFNPAHDINYDINSYGLNIFRANAMDREQEIKRSVNKAIEKHQNKKSSPAKRREKQKNSGTERSISLRPWVGVLGPVAALILVGAYIYINPGTANTVKEQVSGIFRLDSIAQSSDEFQSIASSESSIGFSEGERLNGDFGPEDDVLSEEEANTGISEESSLAAETAEDAANDTENEPLATSDEAINEVDSEDIPAFRDADETFADNAMTTPVVAEPQENPQNSGPSISEMLEDDFYLPEKPLYNVKKRPEEQASSHTPSQAKMTYQSYESTSSKGLVDYQKEESPATTNTASTPKSQKSSLKESSSKAARPTVNPRSSLNEQKTTTNSAAPSAGYQVVVGAFSSLENANNYVQRLKSEGWSAYTYRSGNLNRVAIGSLQDEQQVQKLLKEVKQLVNANAWVNQL